MAYNILTTNICLYIKKKSNLFDRIWKSITKMMHLCLLFYLSLERIINKEIMTYMIIIHVITAMLQMEEKTCVRKICRCSNTEIYEQIHSIANIFAK
jgi:hypothetical protein